MTVIEVLAPGPLTTVQDWPGRVGFWDVGVPPSGPMDDRSLRQANELVGNEEGAPALEVTLSGPRLRFVDNARVAITGAPLAINLDGEPVTQWTAFDVSAGETLALGMIRRTGVRAYLAVGGGFSGPETMGSRSVFVAGGVGGVPLKRGDLLSAGSRNGHQPTTKEISPPELGSPRKLRIALGPHGAPDYLTPESLEELLAATWLVHHQADRTGLRLVGPRPSWSRTDGGEAGLHPSNILDSPYDVGTVMLAGDMAVIVGPDGPSLGGFVAIGQVIEEDRWQLGQLRAGDELRFDAVSPERDEPRAAERRSKMLPDWFGPGADGGHGRVAYRRAGESAVLVEFGEHVLDLRSRVLAHSLQQALLAEGVSGLGTITPAVRSLHIQYDRHQLEAGGLLEILVGLERELPDPVTTVIPGRTLRLPLTWRHSEVQRAIDRYQSSVREDAPWCPDNIEFIRRINGLSDEQQVRDILMKAEYLVLGLGDVYLGAPCAVPIDPSHRLVTTKYNPARTWTPSNAVGIGGVFMCIYAIESPGGYQLVGRTVPIWHAGEKPQWLLRNFDRIRFDPVEECELEELRAASAAGAWRPEAIATAFSLAEDEESLESRSCEIRAFMSQRDAAFAAERDAWLKQGETSGVNT